MEVNINDLVLTGVYNDEFDMDNTHFKVFLDPSFYDDKNIYEKMKNQNNSSDYVFHNHIYNEVLFFKEGSFIIETPGKEYSVPCNSVIFIPSGILHISTLSDNCRYYSLGFVFEQNRMESSDNLYEKFDKLFSTNDLVIINDENLVNFASKISDNLKSKYFFSQYLINNLFREVVLELSINLIRNIISKKEKKQESLEPNYFYTINQKLNSLSNMKLKDIANDMFVSERQLSRIIKQTYGVSFQERKNTIMIESAKRLLDKEDFDIDKISEILGFSSQNAFIKFFQDKVGVSPSNYKNRK